MKQAEHKVVKIFTAQDSLQAETILLALQENNIPAYREDIGNAGLMNLYAGSSTMGANIYVADINEKSAITILEGMGFVA